MFSEIFIGHHTSLLDKHWTSLCPACPDGCRWQRSNYLQSGGNRCFVIMVFNTGRHLLHLGEGLGLFGFLKVIRGFQLSAIHTVAVAWKYKITLHLVEVELSQTALRKKIYNAKISVATALYEVL
jgi:hypothetical protein